MKKSGKTFPDLNGDGETTYADVLKGRGAFKKGGRQRRAAWLALMRPKEKCTEEALAYMSLQQAQDVSTRLGHGSSKVCIWEKRGG